MTPTCRHTPQCCEHLSSLLVMFVVLRMLTALPEQLTVLLEYIDVPYVTCPFQLRLSTGSYINPCVHVYGIQICTLMDR